MDTCPQITYGGYAWQATAPGIIRHFKSAFELVNSTGVLCHQKVQKKFTTGALIMLFVILIFLILTLIRSAVSIYESCKTIGKETSSSITIKKEKASKEDANAEEKKKPTETSTITVSQTNLKRFLDCFCIQSNARKILSTVSSEEQLCCLHGIRSIILIWVICGHNSIYYLAAVKKPEQLQSLLDIQASNILKNTVFIVDAFLILSGFLNGYSFSQLYEKTKGKVSWLSYYLHRIIRIIPLYFIVLGFYTALFPYLGSGPVWPTYDTNPVCKENWIWNVLFLNNMISHKKLCLTQTWYLSCEMQLYIISPIFLILLMRRPKMGYFLTFLDISLSCYINFVFTKEYKLVDGASRIGEYYSTDFACLQSRFWEYFDILYSKPYARLGNYLFGMALGCYLYRNKTSKVHRISMVKLTLGWIMAVILLFTSIFALYEREESVFENAVYNGLKHVIFSSSVAWIIFVCVTGQGGIANKFLSSKVFIVISRLSYTANLTHFIMLEGHYLSLDDLIEHSILKAILYLAMILWIIPATFVVSLIFEAPILRITSLFTRETNKKTKSGKQE